jgi:hypothetical protein
MVDADHDRCVRDLRHVALADGSALTLKAQDKTNRTDLGRPEKLLFDAEWK